MEAHDMIVLAIHITGISILVFEIVKYYRKYTIVKDNYDQLVIKNGELRYTLSQREESTTEEETYVAINFSEMAVFSIERCNGKTIIGYKYDGKVKEWNLYISITAHNALVKDYIEYCNNDDYAGHTNKVD